MDVRSEAALIPPYAGEHMAEGLADPLYAGLLSAALRPDETVQMASFGAWLGDWDRNPYAKGTAGLMVITEARVIFIRPRRRTLGGKLKERGHESYDLTKVFTSGKFNTEDNWTTFGYNNHGMYDSYLLKIDGPSAPLHCSMWTNELWDCAIAAGGHENRPVGI